MRALLGWFLILGCVGLYGYWQTRPERDVRGAGAEASRAGAGESLDEREGRWHTVTIGRPSGARPIELEGWPVLQEQLPSDRDEAGDGPNPNGDASPVAPVDPPPSGPADFEYTVPRGRVLSKICEEFYGSGRAPIPERLAEYNGMSSPDSLRAGQQLLLPAWEVLFPNGRERP